MNGGIIVHHIHALRYINTHVYVNRECVCVCFIHATLLFIEQAIKWTIWLAIQLFIEFGLRECVYAHFVLCFYGGCVCVCDVQLNHSSSQLTRPTNGQRESNLNGEHQWDQRESQLETKTWAMAFENV